MSKAIHIKQSKKIYQYIIDAFIKNHTNGVRVDDDTKAEYYNDKEVFTIVTLEDFMRGKQDRESLKTFYNTLIHYYQSTFYTMEEFEHMYLPEDIPVKASKEFYTYLKSFDNIHNGLTKSYKDEYFNGKRIFDSSYEEFSEGRQDHDSLNLLIKELKNCFPITFSMNLRGMLNDMIKRAEEIKEIEEAKKSDDLKEWLAPILKMSEENKTLRKENEELKAKLASLKELLN